MTKSTTNASSLETPLRQNKWALHRRVYDWVLSWAYTPYGVLALVLVAFTESSFFIVPPDVLLIPLVLGAMHKWWRLALYCTLASVFGGLFGYLIGYAAWETLGIWIVENLGHVHLVEVDGRLDLPLPAYLVDSFSDVLGGTYLFQVYDHWNAWIVMLFGITPIPYKIVTITAGVAKINVPVFVAASVFARGARFFLVALVLRIWGNAAKRIIDKHFNLLCVLFFVLLVGGFAVIKLVI